MFYPENFKNRVKKVYPDWDELHLGLDNGYEIVGRYLNDASHETISVEAVLAATSLEELKKIAEAIKVKKELFREWNQLFRGQIPC